MLNPTISPVFSEANLSLLDQNLPATGQSLQLTNFAQLSRLPQMFIMPPASSSSSAPVASPWATGLERAEAALRQLAVAVCLGEPKTYGNDTKFR